MSLTGQREEGLSLLHSPVRAGTDWYPFKLFKQQVKPNTPVLMCSVPGYDASGHVEDLAAEQNTQITSIAIGKNTPHHLSINQIVISKSFSNLCAF